MSDVRVMDKTKDKLSNKYIIFNLGGEEYGMEILKVESIINYKNVTHLPNLPDFVKGVINLRGYVIPIIDLRLRFHLPEKTYDQYTVIIVAEVHNKKIGLIVDTVSSVDDLKNEDIQETPNFGASVNTHFIKGMGKIEDRLIILLDVEKVLSSEEVSHLQKQSTSAKEE